MRKHLAVLMAGVAAVLILVAWIGLDDVLDVMADISMPVLVAVCLIQLAKYILLSLQWMAIVRASGYTIRFESMAHIIMSGKLIESVTPGFKVGGEITKTVMLTNYTPMSMAEALAVTATQKSLNILGFILLCMLSILFLFANVDLISSPLGNTLLLTLIGLIVVSGIVIALIANPKWLGRFLPKAGLLKFSSTVAKMLRRPLWLCGQLAITLFVWASYAIISLVVAGSLGMGLRRIYVIMATYLGYMLGMVPLLPGGLGTTELGLTGILKVLGVSGSMALAMTLVLRFVTYWFVFLISFLWFLVSRTAHLVNTFRQSRMVG